VIEIKGPLRRGQRPCMVTAMSVLTMILNSINQSVGDLGTDLSGVLGYSGPLILPFTLDIAVPRLAATADDPDTPASG